MAAAARLPGIDAAKQIVPFFLDLERSTTAPDAYPQGGTTQLELPNRHLEYALTWYGLALLLLIMMAIFLRGHRRGG
jgi:surfeit locus 1 family protein